MNRRVLRFIASAAIPVVLTTGATDALRGDPVATIVGTAGFLSAVSVGCALGAHLWLRRAPAQAVTGAMPPTADHVRALATHGAQTGHIR